MLDEQAITGDIEAMAFRLRLGVIKENAALDEAARRDGPHWALNTASNQELLDLGAAQDWLVITERHSLFPDMWQVDEGNHRLTSDRLGVVWSADLSDAYWQGFTAAALEAYQTALPYL